MESDSAPPVFWLVTEFLFIEVLGHSAQFSTASGHKWLKWWLIWTLWSKRRKTYLPLPPNRFNFHKILITIIRIKVTIPCSLCFLRGLQKTSSDLATAVQRGRPEGECERQEAKHGSHFPLENCEAETLNAFSNLLCLWDSKMVNNEKCKSWFRHRNLT